MRYTPNTNRVSERGRLAAAPAGVLLLCIVMSMSGTAEASRGGASSRGATVAHVLGSVAQVRPARVAPCAMWSVDRVGEVLVCGGLVETVMPECVVSEVVSPMPPPMA